MADNQQFDNFAEEFKLRIELLRAVGEAHEAHARAGKLEAETLDQLERTRTTSLINRSLRIALREIDAAEREAAQELKAFSRRADHLRAVVQGRRPLNPTVHHFDLEAIRWMASRGASAGLFVGVSPECRAVENFISLSQIHPEPEAAPESADNLTRLVFWMECPPRLMYFVPGSPVHQLIVGVVDGLAEVQAKLVAEMREKLDTARSGEYAKLVELRKFLNLKGE